jgi:hypothetical protein
LTPRQVASIKAVDTVLVPDGLKALMRVAKLTGLVLKGAYLNLNGRFDMQANRQ